MSLVAASQGCASEAHEHDDTPDATPSSTAFAPAANASPAGSAVDAHTPSLPDAARPGATEAGAGRDASTAQDAGRALDAASDAAPDVVVVDAGSAAPNVACGGDVFCADFEDQNTSALTGLWKTSTPNCSGDGKASVDSSVVHGGKRALRIQSGGGTCNHIFATPSLDLTRLQSSLWVRFYVRFDDALRDDHVTFLAMHDEVSQKDLRMGGQKQILMWNRERDDATLPELSPKGVSLSVTPAPKSWRCVEFHLRGDQGLLETYVEGSLVPALVVDGVATQDIDGQWLRPGAFRTMVRDLRFGWESYGSQPMTLWFDDIAIATERVGC